ncbi:MAG TPA: hypothetical protein P5260_19740 [Candidatus Competibacter sp.]|nr:hypothetical protein [Candidatus Competibacteraceae bacterium]HRX63423.1 hypothetical protein [Candidatus Competibacter sp.]
MSDSVFKVPHQLAMGALSWPLPLREEAVLVETLWVGYCQVERSQRSR